MMRRLPNGLPLASLLAVAAAALLFGASLLSAVRAGNPPAVDASPSSAAPAIAAPPLDPPRDSGATVALASDPFSPDRSLPGDAAADPSEPGDSVAPVLAAEVKLLGTVVRGVSPFALCQLPSDAPRIVHVGERLGDLTLISLDQGRATFRARSGTQVELSLFRPGS